MTAKRHVPESPRARQIIGFSLSPDLASKVKAEAAQRQLSLRKLFEEMWRLYQDRKQENKDAR